MNNHDYLSPPGKEYWKATSAIAMVGIVTFFNLHMMQSLLPLIAGEFRVQPATSGLLVSLPVFVMVFSLLLFGPLSDMLGRKRMMTVGFIMVSIAAIFPVLTESFEGLLFSRILQGMFLGALPPAAMAYLNEEYSPKHMAGATAIYISGTASGGMLGRIISGSLASYYSLQNVFLFFAVINLLAFAAFLVLLPPSRHFSKKQHNVKEEIAWVRKHLANPLLSYPFLLGMILHFSFYGVFTYITFRMHESPYNLSIAQVGYIYFVYITGIIFSPFFGRWAIKWGLINLARISIFFSVAGILLTGMSDLSWIIIGLLLFTGGHFTAHSAASSWVGGKAAAGKGTANSLYLVSYYTGGSLGAYALGWVWQKWGWHGIEIILVVLLSAVHLICNALQKAEESPSAAASDAADRE